MRLAAVQLACALTLTACTTTSSQQPGTPDLGEGAGKHVGSDDAVTSEGVSEEDTSEEAPPAEGGSDESETDEAGTDETTSVEVDEVALRLTGCRLQYRGPSGSGTVRLEFPEPCDFSRDHDGDIRIVEAHGAKTLAVEASRPKGQSCDTFIRGVVIDDGALRLSRQTQRVAACLPGTWDRKMFVIFAADTVPAE